MTYSVWIYNIEASWHLTRFRREHRCYHMLELILFYVLFYSIFFLSFQSKWMQKTNTWIMFGKHLLANIYRTRSYHISRALIVSQCQSQWNDNMLADCLLHFTKMVLRSFVSLRVIFHCIHHIWIEVEEGILINVWLSMKSNWTSIDLTFAIWTVHSTL